MSGKTAKVISGVALLSIAAGAIWWVNGGSLEDARSAVSAAAAQVAGTGAEVTPQGTAGGAAPREGAKPGTAPASEARRSIAVEVATARKITTRTDVRAIGSLQSDESVELAPEISGRILEISFEEGRPVKKDAVLVRLDAALVEAEVADAEARLKLAAANNDRARQLSRTGNVTERSRDEAVANFGIASAALELAKVRLSKHVLRAPFDGIAGVRRVSVGAFVNAGDPVVNIEKIDTLKVDFKVPETYLGQVSVGQGIEIALDALPERTFSGTIYAINPLVDVNGRALQVRAKIANPDGALRPGLFARILIRGGNDRDVVVVPESAVLPRSGDSFVYRIEGGKAVEARVRLGERANAEVEIVSGLKEGDIIVTAGQHKLRSGAPVEIVSARPADTQTGKIPETGSVPAKTGPVKGRSSS